jgi:hypothetical protein
MKNDFKRREQAFVHYPLSWIFVYYRCKYTFDVNKLQLILETFWTVVLELFIPLLLACSIKFQLPNHPKFANVIRIFTEVM